MNYSADRVSGTFFLVLGLTAYFLLIPTYVEQVDDGNIAPNTLPNAISVVLAICGGFLIVRPTKHQIQSPRDMITTGLYVVVLGGSIYAMSWFGFEYVAPVLALVIMLIIGERRPVWLLMGVVAMPAFIWFFVTQLLDRALP